MPTENEARESCMARIVANWTGTFTLDNEKFDPPAGRWARFRVRNGDSEQETLGAVGNRRFNRKAVLRAEFFDDVDGGMAGLDEDVRAFRTLFEGVSFDELRFYGEVPGRELGPDGKGRYGVLAEAHFDYPEIK